MKPTRNYPLLLASQFLGAFGDNAILAIIVGQLTVMMHQGLITEELLRQRSALYTSLLFVPYVFLAPLAGFLNDRFAKTRWLMGGNLIKLTGTVVCALSIWFGYAWQAPGYLIVGIGSCIYGPAKYGILPEILPHERLVKANGTVELLTLLAIIFGKIAGAKMADTLPLTACYAIVLGVFLTSFSLTLLMRLTPSNPAIRLKASLGEFFTHSLDLLRAPRLGRVLIGTALFWVCGAAMNINFQAWGLGVLKLENNFQISVLGLWLGVGVMGGSMLAGHLHRVGDLRRTRFYGFALVTVLALIWTVEPLGFWQAGRIQAGNFVLFPGITLLLIAAGFFAGLFLIPLNAALQAESDSKKLGKTIAVQNLCDNVGMLLAGALVTLCATAKSWAGFNISAGQVFLVLAVGVGAVVLWLRIPERNNR